MRAVFGSGFFLIKQLPGSLWRLVWAKVKENLTIG
jgi:hypothetical protein